MTGRSGKGTARQTIRLDDVLWERFGRITEKLGTDRSAVIREHVEKFVEEHDPTPTEE